MGFFSQMVAGGRGKKLPSGPFSPRRGSVLRPVEASAPSGPPKHVAAPHPGSRSSDFQQHERSSVLQSLRHCPHPVSVPVTNRPLHRGEGPTRSHWGSHCFQRHDLQVGGTGITPPHPRL